MIPFGTEQIQSKPSPSVFERRGFTVQLRQLIANAAASLISANYQNVIAPGTPQTNSGSLNALLSAADYVSIIVIGTPQSNTASLGALLLSADYFLAVVIGEAQTIGTASVSAILNSTNYFLAIVNGESQTEIATCEASLVSANYAPA